MAERNPQDATLRNIRALKKRVERCEERLDMLESAIAANHAVFVAWQAEVVNPRTKRKRTRRALRNAR